MRSCCQRGTTCDLSKTRENMQLLHSSIRHATTAEDRRTRSCCQARENVPLLPSTRKYTTTAENRKTYTCCQARKDVQQLQKRGITRHRHEARKNADNVKPCITTAKREITWVEKNQPVIPTWTGKESRSHVIRYRWRPPPTDWWPHHPRANAHHLQIEPLTNQNLKP